MELLDLYTLQQSYSHNGVMLCFNGPLTRSLIEEIGNALRSYMRGESPSTALDVFGAYIEMTQNIRQYAASKGWTDHRTTATVVVAQDKEGRYAVSSGNLVEAADGPRLVARVSALAEMDKSQLKSAYKEQLRMPRAEGAKTGAGLGLLNIARKASLPLTCSLRPLDNGKAFFTLIVII